jgi:hypothetical protein
MVTKTTTTGKTEAKPAATPPMSKELEAKLRERATQPDDRVAEMMRALFATIDLERSRVAELTKKMEAVGLVSAQTGGATGEAK